MTLTVVILIEFGALAANRGRCPLSDLAMKFTLDRSDAFDIYLPNWLARHNKTLFGALFLGPVHTTLPADATCRRHKCEQALVNELIVLWRWLR